MKLIRGGDEWRKNWTLVAATSAGISLAALPNYMFGVMLEPIEAATGWTRAQISTGPAIVSIMGALLAAPAGFAIDRLGSRRTGLMVIALSLVAILGMANVGASLWTWWAAWAIFGVAAGFTSTVWLTPVSATFDAARGMAIALTIIGAGISAALAPPLAEIFVQGPGWRVGYAVIGLVWCAVTATLVWKFVPGKRSRNVDPVPEAAMLPTDDAVDGELAGYTPAQGFRTRAFYALFLASLLSMMSASALTLNLVPSLTASGTGRTVAVAIAGGMGITSILGRLVGGWLMDHYDVRMLAMAACIASLPFPIAMIAAGEVVWIAAIAALVYGFTGGMKFNAVVYLTGTHLGSRSFGLFFGTISITTTLSSGIAPLIANYIYDISRSYAMVFWAVIPAFVAAAFLFAALGPEPDFRKEER